VNGRTLTLVLSVMALGCAKGLTPPTPTTMVTISDPTLLTYDFGTTTMCKEGEELDETSACTVGKEVVETFPKMTVSLTPFSIDIHEVTNVQYRHCVAKGNCTDPQFDSTEGIGRYYNDTNGTYDHYPVVFVTWDQADKYCRSVGKRLPTEYEWERVATLGETTHPWGNTISDCKNKDIAIAGCNGTSTPPGG
jgi:formylglycine-generating enzyme required for sulfatase activity